MSDEIALKTEENLVTSSLMFTKTHHLIKNEINKFGSTTVTNEPHMWSIAKASPQEFE